MASKVVELVYGKHRVYEVVRLRGWVADRYLVRSDDGKSHGTFSRLDEAVARARDCARRF